VEPELFVTEIESLRRDGGDCGGGGNGGPQDPRLHGNTHPEPEGNITTPTADPKASVMEVVRIVVSDAYEEI
jgi:hypothetical protein